MQATGTSRTAPPVGHAVRTSLIDDDPEIGAGLDLEDPA